MYILNDYAIEAVSSITRLINLVFAVYFINKAGHRMKEVMNAKVNDSYSRISIWILKLVIVQEYMVVVTFIYYVILIIYKPIFGKDDVYWYMNFVGWCSVLLVEFVNDVLLVFQVFEWTIML